MTERFDVVAVNLTTYVERHIATGLTVENADALVAMAVMRRGVDEEIFKTVPAGTPLREGSEGEAPRPQGSARRA